MKIGNVTFYIFGNYLYIMWETPIVITLVFFNIIFIAFIAGIVIFIREYRSKKRLHLKEIKSIDEAYQRELLTTQVEIQKDTMQHIGREIHDSVGQKLTLASIYIKQWLHENTIKEKNKEVTEIDKIIDSSLQELRQLSRSLTNDHIKTYDIRDLIRMECEKINALNSCSVDFENTSVIKPQSYERKSVLLRIAQEFLQNSIKHARCSEIKVALNQQENNGIYLNMKDNGVGFEKDQLRSKGIGLGNIEKRAELIGAVITLEGVPNKGTTLHLKIPAK